VADRVEAVAIEPLHRGARREIGEEEELIAVLGLPDRVVVRPELAEAGAGDQRARERHELVARRTAADARRGEAVEIAADARVRRSDQPVSLVQARNAACDDAVALEQARVASVARALLAVDAPVAPALAPALRPVHAEREAVVHEVEQVPLHLIPAKAQVAAQAERVTRHAEVADRVLALVEVEELGLDRRAERELVVRRLRRHFVEEAESEARLHLAPVAEADTGAD